MQKLEQRKIDVAFNFKSEQVPLVTHTWEERAEKEGERVETIYYLRILLKKKKKKKRRTEAS